jgi:hypothetical protein
MNANIDKFYVPNTRMMYPEYFTKVLRVKNKIKKNKLGNHLVVKVGVANNGHEPIQLETFYTLISGVTRAEDYTGVLSDGSCYILFSQADQANAAAILNRLAQCDITGEIVSDQHLLSIEEPGRWIVTDAAIQRPVNGTGPLHSSESQAGSLVEGIKPNLKTAPSGKKSGKVRTKRLLHAIWPKPDDAETPVESD